jgi:hypothetical protein
MADTAPDWVEVVCRASIARLRYGQHAIVDRSLEAVRKQIRAGYLVVIAPAPEADR